MRAMVLSQQKLSQLVGMTALVLLPMLSYASISLDDLDEISHQLSVRGNYAGIDFLGDEGADTVAWYLDNADIAVTFTQSLETYGAETFTLELVGLDGIDFQIVEQDMSVFYFQFNNDPYESGLNLVESGLTAQDIDEALSSWDDGDHVFSPVTGYNVQVHAVNQSQLASEIITVGVLETVPEPSTSLLLFLSMLFLWRRKR